MISASYLDLMSPVSIFYTILLGLLFFFVVLFCSASLLQSYSFQMAICKIKILEIFPPYLPCITLGDQAMPGYHLHIS